MYINMNFHTGERINNLLGENSFDENLWMYYDPALSKNFGDENNLLYDK